MNKTDANDAEGLAHLVEQCADRGSSLVELRCPCRDVGEAIPVGSLRPIWTAHKTLGGHILGHPSCGGFMPTAETTLIPASGNQRAAKNR